MRVLCTGPESSGTRLLTRLVENLGVEAIHRSIPHAKEWWAEVDDIDKILVIVRDPFVTEISAIEAGHPSFWAGKEATFPYRITNAWETLIDVVRRLEVDWLPLTYEGLLNNPQWVMDNVAEWLGVPPKELTEAVKNPRPVLPHE